MFDNTQIQSYQKITAPADLRQKVMTTCENTEKTKPFPFRKVMYGLAPLAACLLLFFSIYRPNTGNSELLLHVGDIQLSSYSETLPNNTMVAPASIVRTVSTEPIPYTVTLTGNKNVEISSADGTVSTEDDGIIIWTVYVPDEDMVFELFLLDGDVTYYIPLQYHVQDGSFSIRCETK